ncbi:porin [Tateyamaria sp. SN6-1]|uniref:porin n=1 Tax=Tateyamaria sp. SN6-1 TaxID=3092148 RepID=UPI0039F64628
MKYLSIALLGATLPVSALAQQVQVTGGSLQLKYSTFADETDLSRLNIEGSVEIGFSRAFSVQVDLGYNDFDLSDVDTSNIGLHGIYHVSEDLSLGAFYVREDVEDIDFDLVGIEAGYETGKFAFEGYIASFDIDNDGETVIGVAGRYGFDNGLGLGLRHEDAGSDSTASIATTTITLDKDVTETVNLFLEVGSTDFDALGGSASETFVGVGGKIVFGAERGATFDQRGLFRLIPGF